MRDSDSPLPPEAAKRLIRMAIPPGALRDSILTDLDREHADQSQAQGSTSADGWYRRQARSIFFRAVLDRLRGRSWDRFREPGDPWQMSHARSSLDPLSHLSQVGRDVRMAIRQLAHRPWTAAVVVLSLSLGIGANTAIFSFVNGLLTRPLGVEEPETLATVFTARAGVGRYGNTSYLDYLDYRDQNRAFDGLAAYATAPMALAGDGLPEVVWGQVASGDFFRLLGVEATLGRVFRPEEDDILDPRPVVVLGYATWRDTFGSDPEVVGRTIRINDHPFTVIGVAPRSFRGLNTIFQPALWAPLSMVQQVFPYTPNLESRRDPWLQLTGRLRPGMSLAGAQAGMDVLATSLVAEHPEAWRGREIVLTDLDASRLGGAESTEQARRFLLLLLAVVGAVLLIACFNVANLELAKATGRRREMALRHSMGASRWQIVQQLLAESVVLAVLSGAGGVLVGFYSLKGLALLQAQAQVPIPMPAVLDHRVLAMTMILALATGILFGLAPALQMLKPGQSDALKEQGYALSRGRRSGRLQRGLVVGQVAVSLVLLTSAGLLVRSLNNTLSIDPGFALRQGLVVPLNLGFGQYDEGEGRDLQERFLSRASSLPGIESAALAAFVPLGVTHGHHDIWVEGYEPAPEESMLVKRNLVSAHYFETMGIPVLRGRAINEGDSESSTLVAMVNQTMARRYWPGRDPIGGQVYVGRENVYTVVGVIPDGKYATLTEAPEPYLILPRTQGEYTNSTNLVVRTSGDPRSLVRVLRDEVRDLVPGLPPPTVLTMPQYLEYAQGNAQGPAVMVGIFGFLAMVLAAVGLYGVMAYNVSQRIREFGVRLALGASRRDVERGVLVRGLKITALGLVIGGVLSLLAGGALAGFLYEVNPRDPLVLFLGVGVLLVVGQLASYLPARWAARADPIESLRAE